MYARARARAPNPIPTPSIFLCFVVNVLFQFQGMKKSIRRPNGDSDGDSAIRFMHTAGAWRAVPFPQPRPNALSGRSRLQIGAFNCPLQPPLLLHTDSFDSLQLQAYNNKMEWQTCHDEYQKLVNRMNTPRAVIDNGVCATTTLVKIDSAQNHGILLDAVQLLTDLDLSIKKAYISSDGHWFMDVFHVTDRQGRKLTDPQAISSIEHSLRAADCCRFHAAAPEHAHSAGLTALELTGSDRPGLLSDVFAVLADLACSVVDARVWTHGGRIASLVFVRDDDSESPRADKLNRIEARLRSLLKGEDDIRGATTAVSSTAAAHADRRLHQMMSADRGVPSQSQSQSQSQYQACSPSVSVQNLTKRGYSVVCVQCRDRPKLLFDVVCTLTHMKYVVFHGTIDTVADRARQEFYIRHSDGSPISSEAERQRVIQCLRDAIERRAFQGLRLELCAVDRRGLLAEVTRTFRENGLSVARAEVSTRQGATANVFYVTDAAGQAADARAIAAVIEAVGADYLKVADARPTRIAPSHDANGGGASGLFSSLSLGSLVKRNLYSLGLIRSCS